MDESLIITTQDSVKYSKEKLDGSSRPLEDKDLGKGAGTLSSSMKKRSCEINTIAEETGGNSCFDCIGHCLHCCDCSLVCHTLVSCMSVCLINALLCQ